MVMKLKGVKPKAAPPPPSGPRPVFRKEGDIESSRAQIIVKGIASAGLLAAGAILAAWAISAFVRLVVEAAIAGWMVWGIG